MSESYLKKKPSKKKKKKAKHKSQTNAELSANVKSKYEPSSTPISEVRSRCSFDIHERQTSLSPEQDSEPDRSNPLWKISPPSSREEEEADLTEEEEEDLAKTATLWEQIMEEYEKERLDLMSLNMESKPFEPEIPVGQKLTAVQYLEQYIFPMLCPALKDILFRAKREDCLQIQKCIFNGLDHISEILWNRNPRHPNRQAGCYKNIFDIPPRPIYPLSWVWTQEEAVTILQAYIRRYLVCREEDCYEMRKFWKVFKQEKKEEESRRQLQYLEELQKTAITILEEIIAVVMSDVEEKIKACFKSCRCECKCSKLYKCCKCCKQEKSGANNSYTQSQISAASELKTDVT